VIEVAHTLLQESDENGVRVIGVDFHSPAIQSEEHVGREECNTLVSIDERVVHEQRFEKGCRHRREVFVIACLRPKEGTLQEPQIPNSPRTSECLDQSLVNRENFIDGEE